MVHILPEFQYWLAEEGPDTEIWAKQRAGRYLTFEADCAGLNNTRMSFECLLSIAVFTGRTLVLPPAEPWVPVDFDPDHPREILGRSDLSDVFDIDAMSQFLPVISTATFLNSAAATYDLPDHLVKEACDRSPVSVQEFSPGAVLTWYEWLRSNAAIPRWNPIDNLYCYPDIERVRSSGFDEDSDFVDQRTLVEYGKEFSESPIMHFPAHYRAECRSFGQPLNMVTFAYPELPRMHRRLIKRAVRYRPEVFSIASRVVEILGVHEFSALHLRRNHPGFEPDLGEPRTDGKSYLDRLLEPKETLYVATNVPESEELKSLAEHRRVLTWKSMMCDGTDRFEFLREVPDILVAPVEQAICALARVFVGTRYSTFSMYIHRLRCFVGAPDLEVRFFPPQPRDMPVIGDPAVQFGRDWSTEYTALWTKC